jgi:hypothetical protein
LIAIHLAVKNWIIYPSFYGIMHRWKWFLFHRPAVDKQHGKPPPKGLKTVFCGNGLETKFNLFDCIVQVRLAARYKKRVRSCDLWTGISPTKL